jgi:hypothetical protein
LKKREEREKRKGINFPEYYDKSSNRKESKIYIRRRLPKINLPPSGKLIPPQHAAPHFNHPIQIKFVYLKTVQTGTVGFCLPDKNSRFKEKIAVFSDVYTILPHLTALDSLIKNQGGSLPLPTSIQN